MEESREHSVGSAGCALMPVSRRRSGRVLVIVIEREDKRNAINAEVTAGIDIAGSRFHGGKP
jgi:hypothetical protein